jgi:hypothetical protein
MVLPFFFPRYVDSAIRGSGRGEEPSGENVLRLIQIRFTAPSLGKITPASQDNSQQREPPIQVQQTQSAFHPREKTELSIFIAIY